MKSSNVNLKVFSNIFFENVFNNDLAIMCSYMYSIWFLERKMLLQVSILKSYYLTCVSKALAFSCHLVVVYTTETLDLIFFFNFSVPVDIQYYISFKCIAYWLDIYTPYEVIPPINVVPT